MLTRTSLCYIINNRGMSINNIPQPRELFFIDTRLSTGGRYNVAEGPDSQEAALAPKCYDFVKENNS